MAVDSRSRVVRLLPALLLLLLTVLPAVKPGPALAGEYVFTLLTVDSAGQVGAFTSTAFDASGNPAISYWDIGNEDLKFAHWNGTAWGLQVVDAGSIGWFASLALDSQGNAATSYFDYQNESLKLARWNGTGWEIQAVDSGNTGFASSIRFDGQGNPAIAYLDLANADLKFAQWNGLSWTLQVVDSTGDTGLMPSLAFDRAGNPAISYYDVTNKDLKLARRSEAGWGYLTVDSSGEVGLTSSLAFGPDGTPAISYYDGTNKDLKFARWVGSGWTIQAVDNSGDSGLSNSLAFDSSGNPAIAYYDATNGDLKFARWSGTGWDKRTVDSAGEMGAYASLAFDAQGNPAISYLDTTNGDLKLAYNFPPGKPILTPSAAAGSTPTLHWSGVTDPAGVTYSLQVDDDADFSSPRIVKSDLTTSTYTLAADEVLTDGTAYYWRVMSTDGGGSVGAWTAASSFTADASSPSVPRLSAPPAGSSTNNATPSLVWSTVTDPSGVTYSLELDDNHDFSSPALTSAGLGASSFAPAAIQALAHGTYYWRVRSIDGVGNQSAWTASWSLSIDTSSPGVAALISPLASEKVADATPILDWSDVADTSGVTYRLELDDDPAFSSPAVDVVWVASSAYELTAGQSLAAGTYYWRVQAMDGAGNEGAWTEGWPLQIVNKLPLSMIAVGLAALLGVIAAPALFRSRRRAAGRKRSVMV